MGDAVKVAFTWYTDPGAREVTHWDDLIPELPRVGDGVSLGDEYPIREVVRVLWVCGDDMSWHAEVTLR